MIKHFQMSRKRGSDFNLAYGEMVEHSVEDDRRDETFPDGRKSPGKYGDQVDDDYEKVEE